MDGRHRQRRAGDSIGSSSAPAVAIAGAAKTYPNGTHALSPVTFDVTAGEFVALLGPSGCGKTTLLRMAAGLIAPSEGALRWWGHTSPPVDDPRRKLAMVFQSPTLMPWARVDTNARLPLDLARVARPQGDAAVRDALGVVGLADVAHRYPRELSGGMQMRVSIARALTVAPALLLMDEPFAALDEFTRHKLDDDLAALWRGRGLTVLFVTHSIQEAVYLATRVVVMAARPGRVVADLAIETSQPRSAAFRGSAEFAALCARVAALASGATSA
jgi:NitT/TauT family transport system ATP-binding protein